MDSAGRFDPIAAENMEKPAICNFAGIQSFRKAVDAGRIGSAQVRCRTHHTYPLGEEGDRVGIAEL